MAKYVYPAVFELEEGGMYSVVFPDLKGCFTSGEGLADAIVMAEDVLAFTLCDAEDDASAIPPASDLGSILQENGTFASYIVCDTDAYRKKISSRSVKKTLSIPEWLNEKAMAAGLNFSQTLQDALKEKLGIA